MHRTLKQDAILSAPPGRRMLDQQRVFDRFRREYNDERPHEALGQRTPAELYMASTTCYPRKPVSPSYPKDWSVYRVRANGTIQMPLRRLMVSTSLVGEPVGIEHHADGSARLFYGPLLLGNFSQSGKFSVGISQPRPPSRMRRATSFARRLQWRIHGLAADGLRPPLKP